MIVRTKWRLIEPQSKGEVEHLVHVLGVVWRDQQRGVNPMTSGSFCGTGGTLIDEDIVLEGLMQDAYQMQTPPTSL